MAAARTAIRYAEHALDAAHSTTDACADRAANCATNRTSRTVTLARTFIRAPLHASEDALRVCQMRNGEEGQRRRRYCELQPDGSFDRQCSGSDLHLYLYPCAELSRERAMVTGLR